MPNKKVLLVEDEPSTLNALQDRFIKSNYEVLLASNGQEGYDKAIAEKPDIIIMDILMPVVDGCAMLKKLRSDEWGITAKVIVLTNLSFNELLALAYRVDGLTSKSDVATSKESVAGALINKEYIHMMKTQTKLDDIIKEAKKIIKQ
ncbi:MAG: response regulator [bacterium]